MKSLLSKGLAVTAIFAVWLALCSTALAQTTAKAASKHQPISLIDWNIQVGSEKGLFSNGWKKRKRALAEILSHKLPDIFCAQEATKEQIDFIQKEVPGYSYTGVGRDDGKEKGEYCAIFYRNRMELLDNGTFWLSDTPDSSDNTWDAVFKRICTWARFRDTTTGERFCVFNTHFPLLPEARDKAVKLLLLKVIVECPRGNFLLVGDFNCEPGSGPWRAIEKAGFNDAETLAGIHSKLTKTYHVNGLPTQCLDAVFVKGHFKVVEHSVLNQRVGKMFPSDHFGTAVKFEVLKQ